MRHYVIKPTAALFPLLLMVATGSAAMSLGSQRGAAIIGKPLDIHVQAALETQDGVAELCVGAEVFFGDNKIDGSRVRVTTQPAGINSREVIINVRTSLLIDEPVVSFNLRAGCKQKIERRYVLLADLTTNAVAQQVAPFNSPPTIRPAPDKTPRGAAESGRLGSQPDATGVASATAGPLPPSLSSGTKVAKPPIKGGDSARMKRDKSLSASVDTSPVVTKPRLKLEPMDLNPATDPGLKLSTELLSAPTTDIGQRALAAALWRALTAQPDDMVRSGEKLLALEASVAALQLDSQKSNLAISRLTADVGDARSERYLNGLVYGLAALLLGALATVAILWRTHVRHFDEEQSPLPWWKRAKPNENRWTHSLEGTDSTAAETLATLISGSGAGSESLATSKVNVGTDSSIDPSNFGVFRRPGHPAKNSVLPLTGKDRSEFAMSMTHMSRAVKAEELLDVQQQADFFVSLGQHEQAIEVLQDHIGANSRTSALIYLDLFNLYHLLHREEDYESLRRSFSQLFNAKMPEFALYSDVSPGLEAYPAALSRIVTLWISVKVLDVIEESIFRKGDGQKESFDLGAYRELLLLYAIAKDILNQDDGDSRSQPKVRNSESTSFRLSGGDNTGKFGATSIQPLSATAADFSSDAADRESVPVLPRPSSRLGLDVDLSELFDELPAKTTGRNKQRPAESKSATSVDIDIDIDIDATPALLDVDSRQDNLVNGKVSNYANLIDFDPLDSSIGKTDRVGKTKF